MQHLATFQDFINENEPVKSEDHKKYPDPWQTLKGDDLKVFEAVERMVSDIKDDWFEKTLERLRLEPICTEIMDQRRHVAGGPRRPKEDFDADYYVFINNFYGKGYIELELDLDTGGDGLWPTNVQQSSHGYPASYGYTVYSYDRSKCEVNYDKDFFRHVLR